VIDKKNDFVLIQVKSSSEFANDMSEAGAVRDADVKVISR